jgi:hypothetical protein
MKKLNLNPAIAKTSCCEHNALYLLTECGTQINYARGLSGGSQTHSQNSCSAFPTLFEIPPRGKKSRASGLRLQYAQLDTLYLSRLLPVVLALVREQWKKVRSVTFFLELSLVLSLVQDKERTCISADKNGIPCLVRLV